MNEDKIIDRFIDWAELLIVADMLLHNNSKYAIKKKIKFIKEIERLKGDL